MAESGKRDDLTNRGVREGGAGMKEASAMQPMGVPISFVSGLRVSVDHFSSGPGGSLAGSGSPHVITPASAAPDGVNARSISWRYCLPGPCGKENIIQTSLSGEPLDHPSPLSQEAHSSPFALPSPLTFSPTTFPDLLPLPSPLPPRLESSWLFRCHERSLDNSSKPSWVLNPSPVPGHVRCPFSFPVNEENLTSGGSAETDVAGGGGSGNGTALLGEANEKKESVMNDLAGKKDEGVSTAAILEDDRNRREASEMEDDPHVHISLSSVDLSIPRLSSPPQSPERVTSDNNGGGGRPMYLGSSPAPAWPIQKVPSGTMRSPGEEAFLSRSASAGQAITTAPHFLEKGSGLISFKLPPPLLMPNQQSFGPKLTALGPAHHASSYMPTSSGSRQSLMMLPSLQTPPASPLCDEKGGGIIMSHAGMIAPPLSRRTSGHVPSRFASHSGMTSEFSGGGGETQGWTSDQSKHSDHREGGRHSEVGKAGLEKGGEEGLGFCGSSGLFVGGGTRRVRNGKQRQLHLPTLVDVAAFEAANHPLTLQHGLAMGRTGINSGHSAHVSDQLALPSEKTKRLRSESFNLDAHSLPPAQVASSKNAMSAGQYAGLPLDASWQATTMSNEQAGSKKHHHASSNHHMGAEVGGGGKHSDVGSGLLECANVTGEGGGEATGLPWDEGQTRMNVDSMYGEGGTGGQLQHGGNLQQQMQDMEGSHMLAGPPKFAKESGGDTFQCGGRSAHTSGAEHHRLLDMMGSDLQTAPVESATSSSLHIGDWFFQEFVSGNVEPPQKAAECITNDARLDAQEWGKPCESDWGEFMLPDALGDCEQKKSLSEGTQADHANVPSEKGAPWQKEQDNMAWEASEDNVDRLFQKGSGGLLEGATT